MSIVIISVLLFVVLFRIYMKSIHVDCNSKRRLDGKTCVVTGGTSGMGLITAKDLARRGAKVIIACPFPQEGIDAQAHIIKETGNQNIIFKQLNLASLQSTREFADDILKSEERLDILVNNAGIGSINKLTKDGMLYTMQINYYGHFLLTNLLLPLLKKTGSPDDKSRIVNVSSTMYTTGQFKLGNMNKPGFRSYLLAYSDSKLCLLLFAIALTKRLKGSNVIVNSVDPGAVGTYAIFVRNFGKLGAHFFTYFYTFFFKNPVQGAQSTIYATVDESVGSISGRLFRNCNLVNVFDFARDPDAAEQLWEESTKLVKLVN